ncbi:MAG TPA: hypothetical protein VIJ37_07015 [Steroidobacteraceae bacterium]
MHRFGIIVLAIAFSTPARIAAQQAARVEVSPAIHVASDSTHFAPFRGAAIGPSAPVATSTRRHHVWVGAAIGAALGAAAGIIASQSVAVGCIRDPCHATRTRIDIAIGIGTLGAIGGGIVGAAVGAILPATVRDK